MVICTMKKNKTEKVKTTTVVKPKKSKKPKTKKEKIIVVDNANVEDVPPEPASTSSLPAIKKKFEDKVIIEVGRHCKKCYLKDNCKFFIDKDDAECTIEAQEQKFEGVQDLMASLLGLMRVQIMRINRMVHIETTEGGYAYTDTSKEMDRLFEYAEKIKNLSDDRDELTIKAKGKAGGGILAKLFGDAGGNKD